MHHELLLKVASGLARVALAMVLGAAMGLNRSMRGKSVGPRTIAMVSMGAALMSWAGSLYAGQGQDASAATRVLQGLITGIGFLGAGVILHDRKQHVRGLTTAATIWFSAALGGVIGLGEYIVGSVAAAMAILVLISRPLEMRMRRWFRERRHRRHPELPQRRAAEARH